jgi:hypothetical protein
VTGPTYRAAMNMPSRPSEQIDVALTEAWEAAEYCKRLLDQNNVSTAAVWAATAQAWAAIAGAVAARPL